MGMKMLNVRDAGKKDYRHVDCGGMMAVDGTFKSRMPIGLGFGPDGKFRIDSVERKGFHGCCMKCGAEGGWQVGKGKLRTRHPAAINRKIELARAS